MLRVTIRGYQAQRRASVGIPPGASRVARGETPLPPGAAVIPVRRAVGDSAPEPAQPAAAAAASLPAPGLDVATADTTEAPRKATQRAKKRAQGLDTPPAPALTPTAELTAAKPPKTKVPVRRFYKPDPI